MLMEQPLQLMVEALKAYFRFNEEITKNLL
jgi:hypothetical protein